jgi:hypothetical protein
MEFVILMNDWGDYEMSDLQRERLEGILNSRPYNPGEEWIEDGEEVEWTVRATFSGEAEGSYYRRPDGTLQIMGYSISPPDGFDLHLERALDGLVAFEA